MRSSYWLLVFAFGSAVSAANPEFERDIRPLLQKRCMMCHGPAQQMGGVRFDDREQARKGGYSGPVIIPGNAAGSRLMQMITTGRDGRVMPPAGPRLTTDEITLLRAWIDAGAVWPVSPIATTGPTRPRSRHWAFQPVRRPEVPKVASGAI